MGLGVKDDNVANKVESVATSHNHDLFRVKHADSRERTRIYNIISWDIYEFPTFTILTASYL